MTMPRSNRTVTLRIVCFTIALLLGIAQTWSVRHDIFSDGISYLEIASRYAHGDWANAVNPYWSPFYSWLIAIVLLVLRPTPYWQASTLHVVNFFGYLGSLIGFEFLLREIIFLRGVPSSASEGQLRPSILYLGGYSTMVFGGLALIHIGYCSPDLVAMALFLWLMATLVRIQRTGGSTFQYAAVGILCGLSFLARTAFAPSIALCFAIMLFFVWKHGRPLVPAALTAVCLTGILTLPFLIAISRKAGELTIGESGKLNYGWEIDGAPRFAHWQGEPGDIGHPVHPTTLLVPHPTTYAFVGPVPGTYAPWYDPSYWYQGIHPKLKLRKQLRVLFVNLTVAVNLMIRSPFFLPACVLILLAGVRRWWPRFLLYWPILAPALAGVLLYCLVYVEKRYLAAYFIVIWTALLASVPLTKRWLRAIAGSIVVLSCLVFLAIFVGRRMTPLLMDAASDLVHHHERYWNVNYLLAEQFRRIGLQPGDKIAYIGPAVDADWARIDGVRIVAEIPLIYERKDELFDNLLVKNASEIRVFWDSSQATRDRVLQAFRNAGAKMVVTDGYFCGKCGGNWTRVLPYNDPHVYETPPPDVPTQLNTRYMWLVCKNDGSPGARDTGLTANDCGAPKIRGSVAEKPKAMSFARSIPSVMVAR